MPDSLDNAVQLAQQTLSKVFGYTAFRHAQEDIIRSVLSKQNTLAIMPTGGGKSLCYQIPALITEGITVVISPLISLMQDQVRQLHELDIAALMLNSTLSDTQYQENMANIQAGHCKLLFLAPETALQAPIIHLLKAVNVAYIAIDEAHCISEWGHEFRPEYRQLHLLTEDFPEAVIIALTATATPRVREDIKRQLAISDNNEFIAHFDRPNLYIEVMMKDGAYQQTKAYIQQHKGQSGIIYCQSRSSVDELSAKLSKDGFSVAPYHAGLSSQKRAQYQEQFVQDDTDIIVATIAFGMGINKPDVRFVLHYDLPKNIESYYQQIGRGGRDGLDADCLLLFGYGDTGKIRYFIDQMVNEQEKRLANMHLQQMLALAETSQCRRIPLLQYFGEQDIKENCQKCDNCLSDDVEQQDLTVAAQKFMSCVHRTGQRFGASHIVDVLRGSNAEKVLQNQHNLLSTYDIGNEHSKKEWMALARQLIQQGLLKQDEQFGSLKLTQQALDVLKGKVPFYALLQKPVQRAAPATGVALSEVDQVLLQALKVQRKTLAEQANVPPYAIFSDRSLQEMAHYFPHSETSLLQIHGVGQAKVSKYGNTIIEMISAHCNKHGLSEQANTQTASKSSASQSEKDTQSVSKKTTNIAATFDQGTSADDLAQQQKVQVNTIYSHLYKHAVAGEKLHNMEHLKEQIGLPEAVIQACFTIFDTEGCERLKPAYEALADDLSYEHLHLLRVLYLQLALQKSVTA